VGRKNGWQLAEVMGDETPDRTQRLLYQEPIRIILLHERR
jgi:hypothetical protein